MKISHMIRREDFYAINEKTLRRFYGDCGSGKRLYVYPELNAIVVSSPSPRVRRYLYTEYRISGSPLKKAMVRLYVWASLHSHGLLSKRRLELPNRADRDTLIYPCNKKYRVFDFAAGTVSVIAKDGFPEEDLSREIDFRTRYEAPFIPPLLSVEEHGYTEKILDGYPVARAGGRTKELSEKAWQIWRAFAEPHSREISAAAYAEQLSQEAEQLFERLGQAQKAIPMDAVRAYMEDLCRRIANIEKPIPLTLSHGDLQPGNIWVGNRSECIWIIDWESYDERSPFYDEATLFENIRQTEGLRTYAASKDWQHTVVLAEDMLFRLRELCHLPQQYGTEDFAGYFETVEGETRCLKN